MLYHFGCLYMSYERVHLPEYIFAQSWANISANVKDKHMTHGLFFFVYASQNKHTCIILNV